MKFTLADIKALRRVRELCGSVELSSDQTLQLLALAEQALTPAPIQLPTLPAPGNMVRVKATGYVGRVEGMSITPRYNESPLIKCDVRFNYSGEIMTLEHHHLEVIK